jgi:hypothetical protein
MSWNSIQNKTCHNRRFDGEMGDKRTCYRLAETAMKRVLFLARKQGAQANAASEVAEVESSRHRTGVGV